MKFQTLNLPQLFKLCYTILGKLCLVTGIFVLSVNVKKSTNLFTLYYGLIYVTLEPLTRAWIELRIKSVIPKY